MSQDNVKSFEIEAFKVRLAKLTAQKAVDDGAFADAVYTAVSAYGLPEEDFRDAFGLSLGTVERWMQGQNLPQSLVRGKILLWMKDRLG